MSKPVVVVEAASKAKSLQDQFPGGVDSLLVLSPPVQVTYVPPADRMRREPPQFKFSALANEKEFLQKLLSCQGREVYLALDGDWRGDYWSWIISGYWASVSGGSGLPRRLQITGLESEELAESLRLVEPVRSDKAAASYLRMLFDAHLGKHLQRLLGTRSGPAGLPLGFASLTTLFLMAERESEIRMYTPISRWRIRVKLATETGEFFVGLHEAYGITDDGLMRDEKEAHRALDLFRDESFVVSEVDRSPLAVPAPLPYRFVELLHDCHVLHGMRPQSVLAAVRKLYYGVAINGKSQGLITSIFSFENRSFGKLLAKVRQQVAAEWGDEALGPEQEPDDTRGMIIPTSPQLAKGDLAATLSEDEFLVYDLIWRRAMASQMRQASGEIIEVGVTAGEDCIFDGTQKSIIDQGFLAVYQGWQEQELLHVCPVAEAEAGDGLRCLQIMPEKSAGVPPEYYTFEGLATDLADFALDMDGALVTMIQQMLDKGYLTLMPDGSFRCAENTAKLIAVMNKAFPSMQGINLSAYLSQTMEEAISNRKPLSFAMQQFEQTMLMRGEVLVKMAVPLTVKKRGKKSSSIIKTPAESAVAPLAPPSPPEAPEISPPSAMAEEKTVEAPVAEPEVQATSEPEIVSPVAEDVCQEPPGEPEAVEEAGLEPVEAEAREAEAPAAESEEAPLVIEESGHEAVSQEEEQESARLFAEAAEALPEAGEGKAEVAPAAPMSAQAEPGRDMPGKDCPDCGRPLLLKEDRFGRYWYCSGHPECRHSESYEKESGPAMLCPLCGVGSVITKHTPTGKLFYVCPEPDCEFMAWAKPHAVACQVCDSPFLVEKKSLAGGRSILRCPRAGCNYMQPLPGDDGAGLAETAAPKKKKVRVRRVAKGSGAAAGGATRKVRIVRRKK